MSIRTCSIVLFVVIFSYTIFSGIRLASSNTRDFSIFYAVSKDVLHHESPYKDRTLFTAFNYPLATAVIFTPFAVLPYPVSQAFFLFINITAVFVAVFVCTQLLQYKTSLSFYLFVTSLALLAFPTKFTFGMGQTNLLAYALLLIGFQLSKNNKVLAMIFFLISFLFKPILGFTLFVFLLQKKWHFFFVPVFLILATCISIPFLVNQPMANTQFLSLLTHQSLVGREVYYNQGLLGFISRLTVSLQIRGLAELLGILGAFLLLGVFLRKKLHTTTLLSLLLTVLVIIDPLSWQHHFVFLLFPFLWSFCMLKKYKAKTYVFILFWISYLLVAGNIKSPEVFEAFPRSFLLSNQFYSACILLGLEVFIVGNDTKRSIFN